MAVRSIASLIVVTALLSAAAGVAQAADVKPADVKAKAPIDFTVRAENTAPLVGPRTLKWDARKGRWGLMLNVEQPDNRDSNWNDVAAGAYFKITPSLRVGGAVAIGDQQITPGPRKITPDEGQPRVRLETAFKF